MPIVKKISVLILVLLLTLQPIATSTVYADEPVGEEQLNSEEDRVRIFRNLGQFFATFFDPDGLFRFTSDDIFIKNQCLRRDVFALQALKNQISDDLIENYTTITESQLEIQKLLYATYTSELIFLRNLDLLKNDNGEFEVTDTRVSDLRNRVLSKSPNRNSLIVEDTFNFWMQTYQPRFQQYQTCDNSWTRVNRRVDNIIEQSEQIAIQSSELADALVGLGTEIYRTPVAFGRNSYRNIRESVATSYHESRGNFQTGINDFREELQVFRLDIRQRTDQVIESQAGFLGSGQDLGQVLLENTSLTALPGAISRMTTDQETRLNFLRSQIEQSLDADFRDASALIFLPNLIDTQDALIGVNAVLTKDNDGVITLANRINERQCSA